MLGRLVGAILIFPVRVATPRSISYYFYMMLFEKSTDHLDLAPPGGHVCQVHFAERTLVESVARFAVSGLNKEETVVLIGSANHLRQIQKELAQASVSLARAQESRRLILLDAGILLKMFMRDGEPDKRIFKRVFGELLESLNPGRNRIRVWGEMVQLLWRDGKKPMALQLEEMWNQLLLQFPFFLFCTYGMDAFHETEASSGVKEAVFRAHQHTITNPESGRVQRWLDHAILEVLKSKPDEYEAFEQWKAGAIPPVRSMTAWLRDVMRYKAPGIRERARELYECYLSATS